MGKQIYKKVFLDDLPRLHYVDKIDWKKCIDKKIHFIYGDIEDYFIIRGHDIKTQTMSLEYNNKIYYIKVNSVLKGKLGGLFKQKNFTYLYDIGDTITDNGRNMTITDRYKNENGVRCYNYTCNICGLDNGYMSEYQLKNGVKCSCCSNRTVVRGFNDIPTTAHWMVDYFQGGYDEAKKYTKCSTKIITPICPDCKTILNKSMRICDLYVNHGFLCPVCKDGYSYPEKFMYALLKQIGCRFIIQLSKKDAEWVGNYRYDFYLPDFKCIIETHGMQHYQKCGLESNRTLAEEIENDKRKEELAILNNCVFYCIDCRRSSLSWIKESIIRSDILHFLGYSTSDVDWIECDKFAVSNLCKTVSEIKNKNPKLTARDISKIVPLSAGTISRYLRTGATLGWCYYDGNYKRIEMSKDNIIIGIFKSAEEIRNNSKYKDFCITSIQNTCKGKMKSYKGYNFKYI